MASGTVAGRYSLQREIGRGGMGAVWLARDETLGREVALKRVGMFPGGTSPDLARAEREAKLAAKLNHPHVVAVYDFVADGDAQWLVMEYVDGVNLAELSKRRRGLKPDVAAPIIRQAAEALAAAHKAGIVHRDVKPSNILVTDDGTAKLTDFGIARARADSTLTQTGMMTGSPAYLAPEVASGRSASDASDVWSLGATLYQALTGRPPYDVGDNVVGALYKIVHEEPPRLPDAGRLGVLLESTMAIDPKQRWSMAQVRDFLDGADIQPVKAPTLRGAVADATRVIAPVTRVMRPEPTPPPPPPPERRSSRAPLIAGLVGIIVLGVGGWWLLTQNDDDGGNRGPGKGGTSISSEPGATADGMVSFISDYANTLASDPESAWKMLTPQFQADSGGLGDYVKFWDGVHVVQLSDVHADPSSMTVSYHVKYSPPRSGGLKEDDVELRLVYTEGHYLIDAEPTG